MKSSLDKAFGTNNDLNTLATIPSACWIANIDPNVAMICLATLIYTG